MKCDINICAARMLPFWRYLYIVKMVRIVVCVEIYVDTYGIVPRSA